MIARFVLAGALVAVAGVCGAQSGDKAAGAAAASEAWARAEAARAVSRLDVPHRLVAEVRLAGDAEGAPAIATRLWWSDRTKREEAKGPTGESVLAVQDGKGWEHRTTSVGAAQLHAALSVFDASEDEPAQLQMLTTQDGSECLSWKVRGSGPPASTCVRNGVVVSHEAGDRRWELSEFAPFGDKRVPRRIVAWRDGRPESVVRIIELEPLTAPPTALLDGRPPDALDVDDDCEMKPPKPLSRPQPDYPARDLRQARSGTVTLDGVLDVDGAVRQLRVTRGSGSPRIDAAALRAVQQWRYTPSACNGVPRATYMSFTLNFRTEKSPGGP